MLSTSVSRAVKTKGNFALIGAVVPNSLFSCQAGDQDPTRDRNVLVEDDRHCRVRRGPAWAHWDHPNIIWQVRGPLFRDLAVGNGLHPFYEAIQARGKENTLAINAFDALIAIGQGLRGRGHVDWGFSLSRCSRRGSI
jgi:hypothetical protein